MTDKPTVLFVCVHNAGRSQMAAGFLSALAGGAVDVRSAGSEPGDQVNPVAVEAMAEVGIDIAGDQPKLLDARIGCWTTRPAARSRRSVRSATRSAGGWSSC
jgi:protein-tyrosine-phosphatase